MCSSKTAEKTAEKKSFDYMNPSVPDDLPLFEMPLVKATPESLEGFGTIVTDYMNHPVEITQWPAQGWRPIDKGTGDEGGHLEGIFEFWWEGDILFGENMAVYSWLVRASRQGIERQSNPRSLPAPYLACELSP